MKTFITTLLTEMDGVKKNNDGVFVIGTTNRPWDVDSAFKRSGRFGELIYVSPPKVTERIALFKYYTKKLFVGKVDYVKLGFASFGFTPVDIAAVCDNAAKNKASDVIEGAKKKPINTYDLMAEIKSMGKPMLFEWYAKTLEEFKKMPGEERNQYRELKKDIVFWNTRAQGTLQTQLFISTLV